ncbi:Nitric oxide synthase-interacting protein-like protein [Leptotrombidium deliense]|uniref:Nitric oxide synthase-interacting protein homolog n=1 Tax=Leptotrombidium deliense TaxID=299467 RepID=A0A443SU99_9ACAR|nr:Nitric oxide synthase-interacting protein-like protein [Leptotrombidium deliense]
MTRHARNNTASACYSYHERQKDNKKGGYGTQRARLAKDSVKDFDACCLSLQPCRRPVVTPEGYLFDKESILEYIVHQKTEIARRVKEYEKQKRREERDELQQEAAKKKMKTDSFEKLERGLVNPNFFSNDASSSKVEETSASVSNMSGTKDKTLPSFWVPGMTPQSEKEKIEAPDTNVYCPVSGKPLKANKLIEVKFTPIDKASSSSLIAKKERYMCPVTHDALSNSIPCAVLRTSGSVVTLECVDKIIRKEMIDPINGKKMEEKDIIPLQRGGTGFASTNQLKAELKKPVMQA